MHRLYNIWLRTANRRTKMGLVSRWKPLSERASGIDAVRSRITMIDEARRASAAAASFRRRMSAHLETAPAWPGEGPATAKARADVVFLLDSIDEAREEQEEDQGPAGMQDDGRREKAMDGLDSDLLGLKGQKAVDNGKRPAVGAEVREVPDGSGRVRGLLFDPVEPASGGRDAARQDATASDELKLSRRGRRRGRQLPAGSVDGGVDGGHRGVGNGVRGGYRSKWAAGAADNGQSSGSDGSPAGIGVGGGLYEVASDTASPPAGLLSRTGATSAAEGSAHVRGGRAQRRHRRAHGGDGAAVANSGGKEELGPSAPHSLGHRPRPRMPPPDGQPAGPKRVQARGLPAAAAFSRFDEEMEQLRRDFAAVVGGRGGGGGGGGGGADDGGGGSGGRGSGSGGGVGGGEVSRGGVRMAEPQGTERGARLEGQGPRRGEVPGAGPSPALQAPPRPAAEPAQNDGRADGHGAPPRAGARPPASYSSGRPRPSQLRRPGQQR
jgi:hypothetical protein